MRCVKLICCWTHREPLCLQLTVQPICCYRLAEPRDLLVVDALFCLEQETNQDMVEKEKYRLCLPVGGLKSCGFLLSGE